MIGFACDLWWRVIYSLTGGISGAHVEWLEWRVYCVCVWYGMASNTLYVVGGIRYASSAV